MCLLNGVQGPLGAAQDVGGETGKVLTLLLVGSPHQTHEGGEDGEDENALPLTQSPGTLPVGASTQRKREYMVKHGRKSTCNEHALDATRATKLAMYYYSFHHSIYSLGQFYFKSWLGHARFRTRTLELQKRHTYHYATQTVQLETERDRAFLERFT